MLQRFFFRILHSSQRSKNCGEVSPQASSAKKGACHDHCAMQPVLAVISLLSLASKPSSHCGIIFHLIFSHLTHSCLGALTVMTHCCDEWQICFHKCAAEPPPEIGCEPPKKGNLICESVNQSVATLFFFAETFTVVQVATLFPSHELPV